MNDSELLRIVETLPVAERSPFLLAQLAIRQAEADEKKAPSQLKLEELRDTTPFSKKKAVTEEKKAERERRLADLRRATLEDMKTRSIPSKFILQTGYPVATRNLDEGANSSHIDGSHPSIVAIAGLSKAFHDVSSADNAAKTGIVSLYALIGVVITAGIEFVDDQVILLAKIHAGQTQLLRYIEIETASAEDVDMGALLEEDREENSSFGVVEILDGVMSLARVSTEWGSTQVRRRRLPRGETATDV
ncbi:hypothetical protein DFS34DRAFT_591509 [Phlyctochytrium arcticum]|nr:hypothetical protein DFS34DRAFT_591509 [Phlyctochytrium arcticum]